METLRRWALYLLILSIPFNGIPAPLQIGELSRDGFFYASLPYFALQVLAWLQRPRLDIFGPLLRSQGAYIVLIVLSLLINLPSILANSYGSRTGMERYVLSVMVFVYYFLLAVALYAHARNAGIERFLAWLTRAFTALAAGLAALGVTEVISWNITAIRPAWESMRRIVAADATSVIGRLDGVSLEPSFNAFALLACIPWLALDNAHIRARRLRQLLLVLLVLLCLLSGARTAYVGLAAMAAGYLLWRGMLRSALPRGWDGGLMVVSAFALGTIVPVYAFTQIGPGESISNITRSFLMMGAIDAGWSQLWGHGFGQVGFYMVQNTSSAVQYSWELVDFFAGSRHGELPPIFSWYARTFGEFGVLGFIALGASFSLSVTSLFGRAGRSTDPLTQKLFLVAALMASQFLAIAFSIETVRIAQYWVGWVLIALTVQQARTPGKSLANE
ncbi:MAG: hypothetical protein RLW68_15765 [Devosia marina]|uniref:hypothetical protein n=1 Tax=Devosia marina TaxID=2683198 RepID=UPI000D5D439D